MRTALLTIAPLLTAALLVLAGGERLARRSEETRTPADTERLFAFSEKLRTELLRLESLYQAHLVELAELSVLDAELAKKSAESLQAVRLVRVFPTSGAPETIRVDLDNSLPEIVEKENDRVFNPGRAFFLDSPSYSLTNDKWLERDNLPYRVSVHSPTATFTVAILIDYPALQRVIRDYLNGWANFPLTPLQEADERVQIATPDGDTLIKLGSEQLGPSSAIVPIPTRFGTWTVTAWDGIVSRSYYDPTILFGAAGLSVLLLAVGIFLFREQRRAIQLAAERVSFVNRASHELGTPLTNILLNLDLAKDALKHRPQQCSRRLAIVTEEVERLGRLVANVLTFSQRERKTLTLSPSHCDPGELVQSTLNSFRPALERRKIDIKTDIYTGRHAHLDPDALCQITGNLLSNVEKYCATGRWLSLKCRFSNENFILEVKDRGPGIPRSKKEAIFAPFSRIHRKTSEGASGTGLGLTIARELAHRMNGNLELLDSKVGCHFRLRVAAPSSLSVVPITSLAQ